MAAFVLVVGLWLAIQIVYHDVVILHDGWKHVFPVFLSVARETTCAGLPRWIGGVDSGSPLLIHVVSMSVTQLVRVPAQWLTGCLGLGLTPAFYVYKAQLVVGYLVFAAGMYVMARTLFRTRAAALYLFTATLYAGLFLDVLHSSQVLAILFWLPWTVIAAVRVHRARDHGTAARGLAMLALFVSLQALDQYPHFVVLAVGVGGALYAVLWPGRLKVLARIPLWRLWPVALMVLVTASQLWLLRETIADYLPSQRAHLVVDPRQFGETGFVQVTALMGSFLPLGFLAGFDPLGDVMLARIREHWWLRPLRIVPGISRAFIFRLDVLLFYIGFIPTVFAAAFALRAHDGRRRAWWLAWAAVLFLVSLQHSGVYLLILRLPFFNVFRSYFLYVVIVVFAVLVGGGYGMDTFIRSPVEERRRLARNSVAMVVAGTVVAAGVLAWLLTGVPPSVFARTARYLVLDAIFVTVGAAVVIYAARLTRVDQGVHAVIVTLVLSGATYFVAAESMVGMSRSELFARFELDAEDRTPMPFPRSIAPGAFMRKECHLFAQCYASQRDTVSLRRDLEGTFLRHRNEPVFQDDLAATVVKALAGLTHPVIWLSGSVSTYSTPSELIDRLNRHARDIDRHLDDTTYVTRDAAAALPGRGDAGRPDVERTVMGVERHQDTLRVHYRAAASAFLNAAVSYDRNWRATVNGASVPVARGNFNGLVVAVPAGEGEVVFRYRSLATDAFFYTRYLALVVGVAVMAWISMESRRQTAAGEPPAVA